MTTAHITKADIQRGKKILKKALEAAEQHPFDPGFRPVSALQGTQLSPYICISNIRSLIVRQDKAGWYAELLLKDVPEGWPDVVGTASARPLPSRNAAMRCAYEMVNDQYQMERAGRAPKNPFPGSPFIFGNKVVFVSYDGNW
ncbi:hypothetical protein PXK30_21250 [Phaeobacter gallaeciensis]|uniref:hypothetical protein n=1 Tax=Phaeobacter gallaeciensis TaxID=60890 RepID=UPI00237F3E93|nr:hypothetical protein [Phaeobacter gallaeciensis]MDE4306173.1 hypothetical protein [Phaeobacter gallaeciensis]MDE4310595.1 hypothetical protein [Phaeobacter gallaeciensis]MDE4315055.1 hypothetical protein [Phaeobacter gallaeciensis]MDE4319468.1 hypothetical protein [Phaeobacter gallaeciensis]MDE4323848.1 hypothetical protein [Phaeobacter gallaeciensis]